MMKKLAFVLCLVSTAALAQGRPISSVMTCAQVQAMVAARGAVVMNFTPTTYDRVVLDRRFCLMTEVLIPLQVPARDTPQCFAGYTCREGDSWND